MEKYIVLYNMGNAQFRLEKYREAIKSYEEAIKINPNFPEAKFNLVIAVSRLNEEPSTNHLKIHADLESQYNDHGHPYTYRELGSFGPKPGGDGR